MNEGEKKVISKMIAIYCNSNHNSQKGLCEECEKLDSYAHARLERCPFGEDKPTCGTCSIHCYKKDMREKIREVMRKTGPRMLLYHPIITINHFMRERRLKKQFSSKMETEK